VADDDGAYAAEAAGDERPKLCHARGRDHLRLGLDLGLELLLALGDVGELVGDGGDGRAGAAGLGW
jgi:hypothetical protein